MNLLEAFKKTGLLLLLGLVMSCGSSNNKEPEPPAEINPKDIKTGQVVSFYNVYKNADLELFEFYDSIPKIEGLTLVDSSNYQNYLESVIGITYKESNKMKILSELNRLDFLPKNSFFVWSKRKQDNTESKKEFYSLYLLKEKKEVDKIKTNEITLLSVEFIEPHNEFEIRMRFNTRAAKKWGHMTTKAYQNQENIAMVIDSEVYSCIRIGNPILGGESLIPGFQTKEEAEKIVARIKNLNQKI